MTIVNGNEQLTAWAGNLHNGPPPMTGVDGD